MFLTRRPVLAKGRTGGRSPRGGRLALVMSLALLLQPIATGRAPAQVTANTPITFVQATVPDPDTAISPSATPPAIADSPIVLDTGAVPSVTDGTRIQLNIGGAAADAAVPERPDAPIGRMSALWPLRGDAPVRDGRFRLTTERDHAEFSLFVPDLEIPSTLSIASVSSAYVFPGTSLVRVSVDGAEVGEFRPVNLVGSEPTLLPLPAGVLKPGFNTVRIEVTHRHRIYCGYVSAYDLWTDIDLSESGVRLADDVATSGTANGFLAALATGRGHQEPVRMLAAAGTRLEDEMLATAHELGRILGGGLSFTVLDPTQPVAASAGPLVIVARDNTSLPFVRFRGGLSETMFVQFGGTGMPDLANTFEVPPIIDSNDAMVVGARVPLRTVGFEDQQVSQHLWQKDVTFSLPEEWLVATSERSELQLQFANSSGLPMGARLLVFINDIPIRMLPLHEELHLVEDPLPVRFGSEYLTPGRNVLTFQLLIPGDPPDAVCPLVESPRLVISADSTLYVPKSPRMYVPDIQRTLSGLDIASLKSSVTDPSGRPQFEKALSVAAAIPASSADRDVALVVMDETQLDPASFGALWPGRMVLLNALRPPADANGEPKTTRLQVIDQTPPTVQFASLDPSALVSSGIAMARTQLDHLHGLVFPDPAAEVAEWLGGVSGQALLYQLDRDKPGTLYLAVASDAQFETVVNALGLSATAGFGLNGHLAVLGWDGIWRVWKDQSRLPILVDEITSRNVRAILGNYASARPSLFVCFLLAMTLLSVGAALSFIRFTRRRP